MVSYEMYVHCQEEKFHSTNLFVDFVILDSANLKVYESHTTFLHRFDVSDGIKLRYA